MRKLTFVAVTLVVVAAALGFAICYSLHHVVPQPESLVRTTTDRYFYASIEPEDATGIPYWTWLVLPRVFREYLPATGGYTALGMSWDEGREMPAGFAKQRIGYVRVTGNCALCHALSRPGGAGGVPQIIPSAPGQVTSIEPLLAFYRKCAADPRFTADEILAEIDTATPLSFTDRLLYRHILIPRTRDAMLHADAKLLFGPTIRAHLRDPKRPMPPLVR